MRSRRAGLLCSGSGVWSCYPFNSGNTLIAFWPHPAQLRREAEDELRRMHAVKLKQHHGSSAGRRAIRRKHDLSNSKSDVTICNDGAVGAYFHLGGLLVHVDGNGVALDIRLDSEVRQQLDGKNPGFKCAVLLAEDNAPFTGDCKRLLSFGVRANHRARAFECDGGKGVEVLRLG